MAQSRLARSGLDPLDLADVVRLAQRRRVPVAVACRCGSTGLVRDLDALHVWQHQHRDC